MIRVGIVFTFDNGWMGGVNYFRNLLTALYEYPKREIEVVIFAGVLSDGRHLQGFPAIKVVRNRMFDRGSLPWLARMIWKKIFSYDWFLERLLKSNGIDVLSHSGWIGKNAKVLSVGWITDFQHIHLPEFYDQKQIKRLDSEFKNICRFCDAIIVSSHDALSDLQSFYSDCTEKAEVLQFVGSVSDLNIEQAEPGALETKYGFSGKYFFLPNQFWKHKNHSVVIEALGILAAEGEKIRVLATGNTYDYRHPKYFASVMERVKELGLLENFMPLGLIPSQDFAALMRCSIAVINPSLFEGWSTTVEEAKSLGKSVILSDIPVHREQNPELARYFPPTDAIALAKILREVWAMQSVKGDDRYAHARQLTDQRRARMSEQYQQIVLKVADNRVL